MLFDVRQLVVAAFPDEMRLSHDGKTQARDVCNGEIRRDGRRFDALPDCRPRFFQRRQGEDELDFRRTVDGDAAATLTSTTDELGNVLERRQICFMKMQLGRP